MRNYLQNLFQGFGDLLGGLDTIHKIHIEHNQVKIMFMKLNKKKYTSGQVTT